jgi:hypothetical protein
LDPTDFVIPRVRGGFKGDWIDTLTVLYKLPSRQYIVKKQRQQHHQRRMSAPDATTNNHNKNHNGETNDHHQVRFADLLFHSNNPPTGGSGRARLSSFEENEGSVTSEVTVTSTTSRNSGRKSITETLFAPFLHAEHQKDFELNAEMFVYRPQESLDWQDIVVLKHYSMENPQSLVGFQITRSSLTGGPSGKREI